MFRSLVVAFTDGQVGSEIPILYKDREICIIDKPKNLFVHKNQTDKSAPDCVTILSKTFGFQVLNVHRIDRPTSGIVVFALTRESAAELSRQLRQGLMDKRYLALVRGHIGSGVEIDHPVPKSKNGERTDARSSVHPIATSIVREPVGRYDEGWFTLAEIRLHTGRYHQARRHLRSIGHPVVGDSAYGDPAQNAFFRTKYGEGGLFLRAHQLRFTHPATGARLRATAGLPRWWRQVMDSAGFSVLDSLADLPSIETC